MEWDAGAGLGLAAGGVAFLVALVVLFAAPGRQVNRLASLFVATEGIVVGAWYGLGHLASTEAEGFAAVALGNVALIASPFVYLLFLAHIDSPLTRPFRGPRASRLLAVGGVVAAGAATLFADKLIVGVVRTPSGRIGTIDSPLFEAYQYVVLANLLYGLAVAASVYRRATGTAARRQAGAYLAAFALRDAGYSVLYVIYFLAPHVSASTHSTAIPIVSGAFVLLIGYGVLRAQLFDIDVRIRWTISRGSVASVFLGVFVGVSEVAQNWLSDAMGYLAGGVAAAVLLLAIVPLQRAAERLARAALPGKAFEAMSPDERAEVYREQAELAWASGALDARGRLMLNRLRERLGIDAEAAMRLEESAAQRASVNPSS